MSEKRVVEELEGSAALLGIGPRVLLQTRDFRLQLSNSCLQGRDRLGDCYGNQLANSVFGKELGLAQSAQS